MKNGKFHIYDSSVPYSSKVRVSFVYNKSSYSLHLDVRDQLLKLQLAKKSNFQWYSLYELGASIGINSELFIWKHHSLAR